MKRNAFILPLLIILALSSFDLDAKKIKQKSRQKQRTQIQVNHYVTEVDAIIELDKIFEKSIIRENLSKSFDRTRNAYHSVTNGKYGNIKDKLIEHYNNLFYQKLEEGNILTASDCALKYICLGGENDITFYSFLIEHYADNNKDNFLFLLKRLEDISAKNEGKYNIQLSKFRADYDDVLNPKTFEESVIGKWVAVDPMGYTSKDDDEVEELGKLGIAVKPDYLINPLVINVSAVDYDEGLQLLNSPLNKWKAKKKFNRWSFDSGDDNEQSSRSSQSLFFDGNAGEMDALFLSKKIKNPNSDLAKNIRKTSYDIETESQARINTSEMGFGDKMRAQASTTTTTAFLNSLAESAAKGYVHEKVMGVFFNAENSKQMNIILDYDHIKAYSKDHYESYEQIKEQPNRMVKWEERDSVVFVINGKPMFAGDYLSDDSPLLEEYHKIKKEFSWSKPKYVFPTIGFAVLSAGIGVGLGYLGAWFFKNAKTEQDQVDGTKFVLYAICLAPAAFCWMKKNLIDKPRRDAMNWEYDNRINRPNMQKLREKASIAVTPTIGLNTHFVGVNMAINF